MKTGRKKITVTMTADEAQGLLAKASVGFCEMLSRRHDEMGISREEDLEWERAENAAKKIRMAIAEVEGK